MKVEQRIDPDLWRQLYELASRVYALAPWKWMEEIDIFGVEVPGTEDLSFVSVMGANEEHYAVAVYPNVAALTALWALHDDEDVRPEHVLEIPQLHLSFENRDFLEPEDRRIIKQLGLSFRGKQAWPLFRSYRPGFASWFLEHDEAVILRAALQQLLDVGPRLLEGLSLGRSDNSQTYLVRVLEAGPDGDRWSDRFRDVPPANISIPRVLPGEDAVRKCHALPRVENGIEVDLFLLRAAIGDGKVRPQYPYCLLMVESKSGAVVSQELMTVQSSIHDLLRSIPGKLIDWFKESGIRPARLIVRRGRFAELVRPTCEALGIELKTQRHLTQLERARASLMEFLARR